MITNQFNSNFYFSTSPRVPSGVQPDTTGTFTNQDASTQPDSELAAPPRRRSSPVSLAGQEQYLLEPESQEETQQQHPTHLPFEVQSALYMQGLQDGFRMFQE